MPNRKGDAYDAIVVGARCAGAATAMLLARAGLRVLLADRGAFPSDIPHGHFIRRRGPERLRRWGLLDPVAAGSPPIDAWLSDLGDGELLATGVCAGGLASAYGPRRTVLDGALVNAAVAAGAELRERWVIEEVTWERDRVSGVRGRAVGTRRLARERAAVTIGADGRRSTVAGLVGAECLEYVAPLTCWYFSYWEGVAPPAAGGALEVYQRERSVLFAFPTNDALFAIFAGWPAARLTSVRANPAGAIDGAVAAVPALAERMAGARRAERIAGATDVPSFRRRAAGAGWALVGDAGCHKDPYLALGICDALRDAERLADAVVAARGGGTTLDAALASYAEARDAATRDDFAENVRRARLAPPPPEILRLRGALRDRPERAREFHLASEGMIAPERFFNVHTLGELLGAEVPPEALAALAAREARRVALAA
jgi:flavin-dependent dehydrogenase